MPTIEPDMTAAARRCPKPGLSVFPVGRDKRPQRALPHADQLAGWWDRWPEANIGVATGVLSGLGVLDADGPEGLESRLEGGNLVWLGSPIAGGRTLVVMRLVAEYTGQTGRTLVVRP